MSKLQSRAKMLFYLGLALAVSWTLYIIFKSPITAAIQGGSSSERMDEAGELEQSGPNMLPSFAGMIQVYDLPAKYLPKMENHHHSGRLVIVGDVHGMLHELIRLLDKVHFDKDTDHLILAGDLISKGPDSTGVVDLAMSLGATAVRGNHEDRIIMANAAMSVEKSLVDLPDAREEMQNEDDSIPEESSSHRNDKDCALAKLLGKKRIQWLEQCPIILRVGKLGSMGEVVVVHAGLAPAVKLEQQDPYMAMNMRTISGDGVPSDKRLGVGWIKTWNEYQKTLPKSDRTTVIYGHDSKRGLQIEKYSMGIDTGCVKGGRLTAAVIGDGRSEREFNLVHVGCSDGRSK